MKDIRMIILLFCFINLVGCSKESKESKESNNSGDNQKLRSEDSKKNIIEDKLRSGDILFISSTDSHLSYPIRIATNSKFDHLGVLIYDDLGTPYIYEAHNKVRKIMLSDWIKNAVGQKFYVKRLRDIHKYDIKILEENLNKFINKGYDHNFTWSDEFIYCSELVWKAFNRGFGVKMGKLKTLKDYNIHNDHVKYYLTGRFGHEIPYDMTVISPVDIYNSEKLIEIKVSDK